MGSSLILVNSAYEPVLFIITVLLLESIELAGPLLIEAVAENGLSDCFVEIPVVGLELRVCFRFFFSVSSGTPGS